MTVSRIFAAVLALAVAFGLFTLPQYLVADAAPRPVQTAEASPDRAAVETIVREYLLENPELLREMADRLKDKDEARAEAERADVFKTASAEIFSSQHQVNLGNPKGDVTVVEFFDYNCGYCKHALADTDALLAADKNVKLVLKEFPVLSQESVDAARVAIAVSRQAPDKYLEFHRRLLSAEAADGNRAIAIAKDLGLDIERLSTDLADPKTEEALLSVQQLARRLGINGTPTYVIGDQVLPGAIGIDSLKEAVTNVRKCGRVECS